MKSYKCLKNDDSGWLDISECYVGILKIGETYFGEEYKSPVWTDFLRIYVDGKRHVVRKSWFEEIKGESVPMKY